MRKGKPCVTHERYTADRTMDNSAIPEIVTWVAPLPVDDALAPEAVPVAVRLLPEAPLDVDPEVFAEVDALLLMVGPSVNKAVLANVTQLLDAGTLAVYGMEVMAPRDSAG